ncbi:MAG: SpvB/TcaC N-terminal domain-containing protein [Candidatus Omnitrophota bacterium]
MPNSKNRTKTAKRILFEGLVLFFCLLSSLLYADDSKPAVVGVSPQFGTAKAGLPVTISTTFSHPNGWQHIKAVYFIISTNFEQKYCPYFYFDLKENKPYIRNDNGTSWLGGYPSGEVYRIENSYARLDCYGTNFQGQGNTLTVNWRITFKKDFAAPWNNQLFLCAVDDLGVSSGWKKVEGGRFVFLNQPPQVGSLTPSSGSIQAGKEQVFTISYSDANGWQDIYNASLIIEDPLDKSKSVCFFYFQKTGKLYFKQEEKWFGGYKPGSSNTIETQYAKLNCSKSKVRSSNNTLELDLALSFKNAFSDSQPKNIYLDVLDISNAASGRIQKGTCIVDPTVDPKGGEVASADNSVKLSIPKGALSEPTPITLNNIFNQDFIKTAAPAGSIIIAAVECKPDGLIFLKPVELEYTLDKAQVPGTKVELALYEPKSKRLILQNQNAFVEKDSYTIKFSIRHFSTYAVLKDLVSQGAPIGAGVKIPLPDMLTGSFSHSIPLTIPPGRKGMQPSIALNYRSSNPNSWTGVGFSLNPGYIVRSTRLGIPSYDDQKDTFYFITDAGSTELVWLIDNLYQAKIEGSFTKFFKENDGSWRILGKDGSQLFFGKNPDAKETTPFGSFSWYLTKAQDTNGNYILYEYYPKTQDNKSYLKKISYTGHASGIQPTHTVEFFLESRPDSFSSYISGERIATSQRLKSIEAKIEGDLVWRYDLDYGSQSNDTGRSLLRSITQFTSDGKEFPKQLFSYQQAK